MGYLECSTTVPIDKTIYILLTLHSSMIFLFDEQIRLIHRVVLNTNGIEQSITVRTTLSNFQLAFGTECNIGESNFQLTSHKLWVRIVFLFTKVWAFYDQLSISSLLWNLCKIFIRSDLSIFVSSEIGTSLSALLLRISIHF